MLKRQVFKTVTTENTVNPRQTILRDIFDKELFASASIAATILVDQLLDYIDTNVQLHTERKLFHPEMIATWGIQQRSGLNTA